MEDTTWTQSSIACLFEIPFFELLFKAYSVHRTYFDITEMELCTLSSIKTGTCPEDCAYCTQSGHYKTNLKREKLIDVDAIIQQAKIAKKSGAKRFCMGAAWRTPPKKDLPKVLEMIKAVKSLGLETCVTLGMLDSEQANDLKQAGLDFYNHNLDTSPDFYQKIITTRTYQDRINTLENVRNAGINVCCGGILGMGESRKDRIALLLQLNQLSEPPTSIPINQLVPIEGTPLEGVESLDPFEFVRTVAITRLIFPKSIIRLSAGREKMTDELQAWCFMAGANSIFYGDKLLTAKNPEKNRDFHLLNRLGMKTPLSIHV
ncbi:biotin synthase BioB [Coxiella endosymbiont of Amblyomma americanum]|uniref:biotin synthase BioB n=1 Tax=Coxiella endosymbiont of Amblyomma americanum TaxID=325775 RepID=UPI00057C9656|nr:biotin synthase BioB [Coxiella endosymbiont of Amblyomma americanum]AJC50612.1 biotin synthase [Coxiella endosymbiont of Amblyomma americanum]AUJ58943.1 biotin synthase BioB [Coxiella-like endosymbiont of Amblyomma americanum]